MKRERGRARENVHVMRLPAEQLKVKCRVSLAVLGHPTLKLERLIRLLRKADSHLIMHMEHKLETGKLTAK